MQFRFLIKVMLASSSFLSSSIRAFQTSKNAISNSSRGDRVRRHTFRSFFSPDAIIRAKNHPSRNLSLLAKSSGDENFSKGRNNSTLYMSTAAASVAGGLSLLENDELISMCEKSQVFPEEVLKTDTYNGVTIELDKYVDGDGSLDVEDFRKTLKNSLDVWRKEGKRGIWINIPKYCSETVPICTNLGFEFQHAQKGLLVMTQWLPQDSESRLPKGPTHQVGVGVIVFHPVTNKMLVVQEKTGPAAAKKLWKMPTGLTDPGEDIVDAAVREAKEETGLDLEFDRIILMRQAHGGFFNQSDMFCVCLLKLAPKYGEGLRNGVEIPLDPQEEEIAEIKWMHAEDFASQETWQGSPLYTELNGSIVEAAEILIKGTASNADTNTDNQVGHKGLVAKTLPIGWRPGSQTVYVSKL